MENVVTNIPVRVSVVLGKAKISLQELLELKEGAVLELDRAVGENVDIYVEDAHVAKGEVVVDDGGLSIVITEILGDDRV